MVSLLVAVVIVSLYSLFTVPVRMKDMDKPKLTEAAKPNNALKEPVIPLANDQTPVPLSTLKGKIVVVDLWATWCGPCKMSMPEVNDVYNRYKSKGVLVVGLSVDKEDARPQYGIIRKSLDYPTAMAKDTPGVLDFFDTQGSIPAMFIFDQSGKLAASQSGYRPGWMEAVIQDLLKKHT